MIINQQDNQMNQNIQLFRTFTNDYTISNAELNTFLKWGNGDVQQALNFYFRKKDKQNASKQLSTQPVSSKPERGVFDKMNEAAKKQKKTEEFISEIRRGRLDLKNNIDSKEEGQKMDEELKDFQFQDADYLPSIFNLKEENQMQEDIPCQPVRRISKQSKSESDDYKPAGHKQKKNTKQIAKIQENRQSEEQFCDEQQKNEEIGMVKRQSLQNSGQYEFEIDEPMNLSLNEISLNEKEIYLGKYFIKAFATEFKIISECYEGTPIHFRSYIEEEKTKKGFKGSKKAEKIMNMRIIIDGKQLGRIQDQEVRILLPLITHKMIRIELFALDIPNKLDTFTKMILTVKVYLLKKAITQPVVETVQGQSDAIVSIYKPVGEQIRGLFEKLCLPIKIQPLIKTKSKFKNHNDSTSSLNIKRLNYSQQKQKNISKEKEKDNDESKKLSDPFYKQIQRTLSDMTKNIKDKNSQNKGNLIERSEQNEVKKTIIELKSVDEDKYTQLIDLYEEDLQPYYPKENFCSELYHYQALALAWMLRREGFYQGKQHQEEQLHPLWTEFEIENSKYRLFMNELTAQISVKPPMSKIKCKGGILADEMGLGKTVMMAALIATHTMKERNDKQGKSLVIVPLMLLSQWQSELQKHTKKTKTLIYYELKRKQNENKLDKYDVIITTYGTVSHEYSKGNHLTKTGIYKYKWRRVILDQAHYIKGRVIQTAKATYEIDAHCRWCLTGTPIQNNLTDLFALVHFIKYTPWSEYECWNKYINKPQEIGDQNVYLVLRTLLKRVFLRRTKNSKDHQGKNIVNLPNKISKIQILEMNSYQRAFYDGIYQSSKLKIEELENQGILEAKYMQVLEILMRLRQICCHPILFKSIPKFICDPQQFQTQLRKFLNSREKYNLAINKGLENEAYFEPLIEGEQQQRVSVSLNQNITEAYIQEVIRKVKNQEYENCCVCIDTVEDPVITSCLHIFCKTCNLRQIHERGCCSACRRNLTKDDILDLPRDNRFNISLEGKPVFKSTKILALLNHLKAMKEGDKAVIFSQFLGMLDLIEFELKFQKFNYLRMEGSTTHSERTRIIKAFQTDLKVKIFLVSLKTAGVGLNLVAANKVFLVDPWWNPGVEDQAIERVHRIGQTKQVEIIRFIMDKSIEMRMMELNTNKKKLSNAVLSNEHKGNQAMGIEKLKYLMEKY